MLTLPSIDYRNGQVMGDTCNKLLEPEDVTVGTTIGESHCY